MAEGRTVEAAEARAVALAGNTDVIPQGAYCYRPLGKRTPTAEGGLAYPVELCPYWGRIPGKSMQESGYCAFLKLSDCDDGPISHLWDQVKECGINDPDDFDVAAEASATA